MLRGMDSVGLARNGATTRSTHEPESLIDRLLSMIGTLGADRTFVGVAL